MMMTSNFPPGATPNFPPLDWLNCSVPEGGFTIRFPQLPEQSAGELESHGIKVPVTLFRYFDHSTTTSFSINYNVFPHNLESPAIAQQLFQSILATLITKPDGVATYHLLEETTITLNGHPGRFWIIEVDHQATLRAKSYAVGNRLYQIVTITMNLAPASPARTELQKQLALYFLDSFELIEDPDKPLFIE